MCSKLLKSSASNFDVSGRSDPRGRAAVRGLVDWTLRLILAGVLLYAGFVKAGDAEGFALALAPFTFVPEIWLPVIAFALPWLEIALGIGLLLPRTSRVAGLLAAALFSLFLVVIAWALSEGIIVSCGCFGEEDEPPSARSMQLVILRNAVLVAAALWVAFRPPGSNKASPAAAPVP